MVQTSKLLAIGYLFFAACVDTGSPAQSDSQSTQVSDLQSAAKPNGAVCDFVWTCEQWVCPSPWLPQSQANVLHEYCPDGSDTVVQVSGCNDGCF